MVFGRKKPVMQEKEPEVIDAKKEAIEKVKELTQGQKETLEIVKEFSENYDGVFSYENLAYIKSDVMICNLLVAIYAELKKLRKDVAEQK